MLVGYSLSPGGLLFPWHIGTLACLSHNEALTDINPLAGSSAGAIAVASHGANVAPEKAIEATVRMSDDCRTLYGGARGNLLPLLKRELDEILDDDVHKVLNEREGFVGLAYKEIFPVNRSVLDTHFYDKDHVIDSVCNSSMFPFFATNWPFRIARAATDGNGYFNVPRVAVDGYFSVDRNRFGCPDFDMKHARAGERGEEHEHDNEESSTDVPLSAKKVDRTVTISVFPHDVIGITASDEHDRISPEIDPENPQDQLSKLFRLATQCATKEEYYQLYEDGWNDAERWLKEEEQRGYWGSSTTDRRSYYANKVQGLN